MNENQIDPEVARQKKVAAYTDQLTDPKLKLTGRHRRRAMRARCKVHLPTQAPKDPAKKLAEKVLGLSCNGLVRLCEKSARRAATAKYLLAKMAPGSKFAKAVQFNQGRELVYFATARAELEHRQNPERSHDSEVNNDNAVVGTTA